MSIKYSIHICILLFIVSFAASCEKYLDEKSDKTLVEVKTISDLQGLLDDEYIMNSKTPSFGQNSDDDFFVTQETYNAFQEMDKEAYTWRLINYRYPNNWSECYNAIYNANYCLEKIGQISYNVQNQSTWNNVKGSALFFRGFYFLNLLWEYAKTYDSATSKTDLGIVLRLSSDFNIPSVRSNVEDSYNQVIRDLKESIDLLPDNPQHVMRPSKAAAYAILARTYLSMRIYDSSYTYSHLALSIKNELLDYNSSDVDASSFVPFGRYNKETIFYTTQSGNYSAMYSFYALADSILYNDYSTDDLRKHTYFFENPGGHSFKGSYAGDMYVFFSGVATDEVLLIHAESAARVGKLDESIFDLNALLFKRFVTGSFVPYSISNQSQIVDLVLRERRKELTMRGLRWIDVKRLNKENRNIVLKRIGGNEVFELHPNSNRYALPLPQDIVEVTGILQN